MCLSGLFGGGGGKSSINVPPPPAPVKAPAMPAPPKASDKNVQDSKDATARAAAALYGADSTNKTGALGLTDQATVKKSVLGKQ